ncbi:MAG: hypothetical protein GYA51_02565, partial [Candidatus Methanofastidiosa archaeon]|nr:hypothetical protein [Candidatus Methanofastidiosa archaeon]
MIKILFDSRNWFSELQSRMHCYFENHPDLQIEPISIFHNNKEAKQYAKLKNIAILTDYWNNKEIGLSDERIDGLERQFNILNL